MTMLADMDSWALALRARNRQQSSIDRYRRTITLFTRWQDTHDRPTASADVSPTHIRDYLAHRTAETSPGTAAIDYRNLRAFFRWLAAEEEIDADPMRKVAEVKVPEKDIPVLTPDEVAALLKTTEGKSFEARRDRAIILVLLDNGVRASGLVGLRYTPTAPETHDVDLDGGQLRVTLKGGDERHISIGVTAAAALDRYIRARTRHPQARRPALWLGPKGGLSDSGVRQMLKRRARQAQILHVHPHLFRHTAAHLLKSAGMSDEELMHICGWKSSAMARRYGRTLVASRARESHRKMSPADAIAG